MTGRMNDLNVIQISSYLHFKRLLKLSFITFVAQNCLPVCSVIVSMLKVYFWPAARRFSNGSWRPLLTSRRVSSDVNKKYETKMIQMNFCNINCKSAHNYNLTRVNRHFPLLTCSLTFSGNGCREWCSWLVELVHIVSWPSVVSSVIPVLKIISVLVSIKFERHHSSISFYTVSDFFSVVVPIKFFLEILSVQF